MIGALATGAFIRRFLSHVLPKGFHRIRHYGLLANSNRAANIATARALLAVPVAVAEPKPDNATEGDMPSVQPRACPCCGSPMHVIEVFARGSEPGPRPTPIVVRIDTS